MHNHQSLSFFSLSFIDLIQDIIFLFELCSVLLLLFFELRHLFKLKFELDSTNDSPAWGFCCCHFLCCFDWYSFRQFDYHVTFNQPTINRIYICIYSSSNSTWIKLMNHGWIELKEICIKKYYVMFRCTIPFTLFFLLSFFRLLSISNSLVICSSNVCI